MSPLQDIGYMLRMACSGDIEQYVAYKSKLQDDNLLVAIMERGTCR